MLTDAIRIIFVELGKLKEVLKKPTSKMTDLEKWAIFLRYAKRLARFERRSLGCGNFKDLAGARIFA